MVGRVEHRVGRPGQPIESLDPDPGEDAGERQQERRLRQTPEGACRGMLAPGGERERGFPDGVREVGLRGRRARRFPRPGRQQVPEVVHRRELRQGRLVHGAVELPFERQGQLDALQRAEP